MQIIKLTAETRKNILEQLLKRSPSSYQGFEERVNAIVEQVRERGDEAVFGYTKQFDGVEVSAQTVRVTKEEIDEAYQKVEPGFLEVVRKALVNIRSYHEKQRKYSWFDSGENGTLLGQKVTPLATVGVYVPGGKAVYPSSVLTNVVTANDITKTWSKKQQSFAIGATALGGAALSYSSNNKSVVVDASGRVTVPKNFLGQASVTIRSATTGNYEAAAKVITVAVNPKGTSLRKLKNSSSKKLTATWKKNADITGYQIQYSTDSKFSSGVKTKTISKKKTVKLTLKSLNKGKKYYVRIRTYKKVGGKKYYSAWSKAKSVKIKK